MKHALIFCASVLVAKCVPEESLHRAPKSDQISQAEPLAALPTPKQVLPSPSPAPSTNLEIAYESLRAENQRLHDQLNDMRKPYDCQESDAQWNPQRPRDASEEESGW